jgi:UDP-N-acetylmuramyl pentapeptide phosphotransferase/UDP-N-acetylglucosamine-1-phosphate transferase
MLTVLIPVVGFVLSYVGVIAICNLAERHKILDIPNERSSHSISSPRGGGLAIVLVTLGGLWLSFGLSSIIGFRALVAYTIGAILIAGISWLDDLRSQPSWLRFTIHSTGALLAIYAFGPLPLGRLLGLTDPVNFWLSLGITFLWIVGLTNAYNFMDGIDGIAGGQAVVAGVVLAVLGWFTSNVALQVLGSVVAASSLGFLLHNWSPARIFMGDVGSAFLGFTFAVVPLLVNAGLAGNEKSLGRAIAVGLPLWPFIFDSLFTFVRRLSLGENVFSAHRSHLYQRLVILGYSHQSVSLLYIALAAVGGIGSLLWTLDVRNVPVAVAISLPLIWLVVWIFVTRQEHKQANVSAGDLACVEQISNRSN